MVSTTGVEITPLPYFRASSMVARMISAVTKGRAASCTETISTSSGSACRPL